MKKIIDFIKRNKKVINKIIDILCVVFIIFLFILALFTK